MFVWRNWASRAPRAMPVTQPACSLAAHAPDSADTHGPSLQPSMVHSTGMPRTPERRLGMACCTQQAGGTQRGPARTSCRAYSCASGRSPPPLADHALMAGSALAPPSAASTAARLNA